MKVMTLLGANGSPALRVVGKDKGGGLWVFVLEECDKDSVGDPCWLEREKWEYRESVGWVNPPPRGSGILMTFLSRLILTAKT